MKNYEIYDFGRGSYLGTGLLLRGWLILPVEGH